MRKKRSEMTPMERMEYIMNQSTWEDAEEVGVEILARCSAMHVYAREEEDYVVDLTMKLAERICKRADEWAHEGNNSFVLACASLGHRMEQKKVISINKEKEIEKYCGSCCWFFGECTDGDGCCAKHYCDEPKDGNDPMLTRCDRKACEDFVSRDEKFIHLKKLTEMLQMLSEGTQEEVAPFTEALQFAIKHIKTFDMI